MQNSMSQEIINRGEKSLIFLTGVWQKKLDEIQFWGQITLDDKIFLQPSNTTSIYIIFLFIFLPVIDALTLCDLTLAQLRPLRKRNPIEH